MQSHSTKFNCNNRPVTSDFCAHDYEMDRFWEYPAVSAEQKLRRERDQGVPKPPIS